MREVTVIHDRWLFYFVYPVIATAAVHIGNENSLAELVTQPSYFSDLLFAFIVTYAAGAYFHNLYTRRPTIVLRAQMTRKALGRSLCLAVLLPVSVLVILEIIYVVVGLGIPLADATIFYLELPLMLLFCLLISGVYSVLITPPVTADPPVAEPAYRGYLVVHSGALSRSIPVADIAYFRVVEKTTFVVLTTTEQFSSPLNLREIREEVDPALFFTLNRQVVASRGSVEAYERTATRKLRVLLSPPCDDEQFVSKTKSAAFLRWLGEGQ